MILRFIQSLIPPPPHIAEQLILAGEEANATLFVVISAKRAKKFGISPKWIIQGDDNGMIRVRFPSSKAAYQFRLRYADALQFRDVDLFSRWRDQILADSGWQ